MRKWLILFTMYLMVIANAQPLFEVKDASDNTVLEVSQDGLRIFNMGDTLMVISSTEIKAFIDESAKDRALSRSFSITTATAGKGGSDVMNVAADGLRVYNDNDKLMDITSSNITAYIDSNSTKALSRSFSITTATAGKGETTVMEITKDNTVISEGSAGIRYTGFSPRNIFWVSTPGGILTRITLQELEYGMVLITFLSETGPVSRTMTVS